MVSVVLPQLTDGQLQARNQPFKMYLGGDDNGAHLVRSENALSTLQGGPASTEDTL